MSTDLYAPFFYSQQGESIPSKFLLKQTVSRPRCLVVHQEVKTFYMVEEKERHEESTTTLSEQGSRQRHILIDFIHFIVCKTATDNQ